jgi:hypothetical protein
MKCDMVKNNIANTSAQNPIGRNTNGSYGGTNPSNNGDVVYLQKNKRVRIFLQKNNNYLKFVMALHKSLPCIANILSCRLESMANDCYNN